MMKAIESVYVSKTYTPDEWNLTGIHDPWWFGPDKQTESIKNGIAVEQCDDGWIRTYAKKGCKWYD